MVKSNSMFSSLTWRPSFLLFLFICLIYYPKTGWPGRSNEYIQCYGGWVEVCLIQFSTLRLLGQFNFSAWLCRKLKLYRGTRSSVTMLQLSCNNIHVTFQTCMDTVFQPCLFGLGGNHSLFTSCPHYPCGPWPVRASLSTLLHD